VRERVIRADRLEVSAAIRIRTPKSLPANGRFGLGEPPDAINVSMLRETEARHSADRRRRSRRRFCGELFSEKGGKSKQTDCVNFHRSASRSSSRTNRRMLNAHFDRSSLDHRLNAFDGRLRKKKGEGVDLMSVPPMRGADFHHANDRERRTAGASLCVARLGLATTAEGLFKMGFKVPRWSVIAATAQQRKRARIFIHCVSRYEQSRAGRGRGGGE